MIVSNIHILTSLEHPVNIRMSTTSDGNDMGYEECAPTVRRGSMSVEQEKERRASIRAVMIDPNISPLTKRRSIQYLMDGRRNSLDKVESSRNQTKFSHESNSDEGSSDNDESIHIKSNTSVMEISVCTFIVPTCNEQTKRAEEMRAHCPHYERNCTMIAPCCGAAFGCRICHDDSPILRPKITVKNKKCFFRSASLPSSFDDKIFEESHHQIDRHAVVEVICRKCCTRQSSKTNFCTSCKVQFGDYHCTHCNLWMSAEERRYHCYDCGFCRVGGKENFEHCHGCDMCIDRSLYSTHNCKQELYRADCPICQEYLFSSRRASYEMPCGHAIHWDCFRQLAEHDLRCPLCKKTAETADRMALTWATTAMNINMQPVPPSMARVVNIRCIDCGLTDTNRAWHFLGTQCVHCTSFNTLVDQIVMQGEKAYAFLNQPNFSKKKEERKLSRLPSTRRSSIM